MLRETLQALAACLVTFALCAIAYPAAVWGLAWAAFPRQAAGSLLTVGGKVVGSELIGQRFTSDRYFHPRISAAGAGYDAGAASGSNLGTKNPALHARIALDVARYLAARTGDTALKAKLEALDKVQADLAATKAIAEPTPADTEAIPALEAQATEALEQVDAAAKLVGKDAGAEIPPDLVTASGSGLDPDVSPEGAHYQEAMVAAARNLPVEKVRALIGRHVERSGAIVGAPPRVNVLKLNLALDEELPAVDSAPAPAESPKPSAASRTPVPAAEVRALADRLDTLQEQIRRAPAPADREALAAKVAEIAGAFQSVQQLNDRIAEIDGRVRNSEEGLAAIRKEVAQARAGVLGSSSRPH